MFNSFYPDGVSDKNIDYVKNKKLLETLKVKGWKYDQEDNIYSNRYNGILFILGLTLMADDNLWGSLFAGGGYRNNIAYINSYKNLEKQIESYIKTLNVIDQLCKESELATKLTSKNQYF